MGGSKKDSRKRSRSSSSSSSSSSDSSSSSSSSANPSREVSPKRTKKSRRHEGKDEKGTTKDAPPLAAKSDEIENNDVGAGRSTMQETKGVDVKVTSWR